MFFKRLLDPTPLKTYTIGLQQAKAYRILKQTTAEVLEKYSLSPLEWAMIGLLFEHDAGFRPSRIAAELGVEAPLVTIMVDHLQSKKMVIQKKDQTDKRAMLIHLSAGGRRQVETIEAQVHQAIKPLLNNTSNQDLESYLKVLESITTNHLINEVKT